MTSSILLRKRTLLLFWGGGMGWSGVKSPNSINQGKREWIIELHPQGPTIHRRVVHHLVSSTGEGRTPRRLESQEPQEKKIGLLPVCSPTPSGWTKNGRKQTVTVDSEHQCKVAPVSRGLGGPVFPSPFESETIHRRRVPSRYNIYLLVLEMVVSGPDKGRD